MATQGLFIDPQELQQAQDLAAAQLTPEQRLYMMGRGTGRAIGQGLGGFFGVNVQDPAMARATKLRELGAKYGTTTAEALDKIAADLKEDPAMAMQVKAKADEMRKVSSEAALTQAKIQGEQAKFQEEQYKLNMEEKLRTELSKLTPDASEEDILKVVTKYGSPDKVLSALQSSQTRRAQMEQQSQLQRERLDEQARRDRERAQDRKELAILVSSLKQGAQTKPLSAAELKDVNKIRSNIDTANNTIDQADTFINLIDENKMLFGSGENALGVARKLFGKSNESDLNKVEFEQFVTSSVNNILNLAKGPQTDQDAKRAEKQIIDGLNKNDGKAVKRGLESLKKVWDDAKKTDMSALELYSSERGGKNLAPSSESAPKGAAPKPTKRFNPATGALEPI